MAQLDDLLKGRTLCLKINDVYLKGTKFAHMYKYAQIVSENNARKYMY